MCNYAKGPCDFESNSLLCKTKTHVFCRNLREKNELKQKENESDESSTSSGTRRDD